MNGLVLLVARILMAIIFILAGFEKLTDISGTAAYFGMYNLPAPAYVMQPKPPARVAVGPMSILGVVQRTRYRLHDPGQFRAAPDA